MPLRCIRSTALRLLASALLLLAAACAPEFTPAPTPPSTPTATAKPLPTPTLIPTATPAPTPTFIPTATPIPAPTPTPTPIPTPTPLLSFPADHGPHDAPIEWWYFNGLLFDDNGGEYSYHFVAFQAPGAAGVTPHLLQATLGDHRRGIHYAAERGVLSPARPDADDVDVAAGGWRLRGDGGGYELRFRVGDAGDGAALELRAAARRPPVGHGGTGLLHLGADAGSTYYYSITRLEVAGWLQDGASRRPVRGPGWMDHQWGEIAADRVGWDWVSVQLDDGADFMAAVVWQADADGGKRRLSAHSTYVDAGGAVAYGRGDGVDIAALGEWESPATGVTYPMGWRVTDEALGLSLELTPYIREAEFDSDVLGVAYWEGAVSAAGERRGRPVGGWGFVELAGYDPRRPLAAQE